MQTMDALYAKSSRFRRLHSRCGAIARPQAMQTSRGTVKFLAHFSDRWAARRPVRLLVQQ